MKLASWGVNFRIYLKWEDPYVRVMYLYLSKGSKDIVEEGTGNLELGQYIQII